MEDNLCPLDWCHRPVAFNKFFCSYHHDKLTPGLKYNVRQKYVGEKSLAAAVNFLVKEHETLVDCPRCKGRGVNRGHTSYLRGKTCSWCDHGKRPKIL